MKIRKESYPPVNIGISFMLVIFIILSMTIFAVLSFSTAMKDYNYSKMNADKTTAYYDACNIAEEELTHLLLTSNESNAEFLVEMNDDRALQVIATLDFENQSYDIHTWKIVSTSEWNGDDTLSVLGSKH